MEKGIGVSVGHFERCKRWERSGVSNCRNQDRRGGPHKSQRVQLKVRSNSRICAVAKASVSMRVFAFGTNSYRRRGSGLGFLLRKMRQTLLPECSSISSSSHTDRRRLPLNYRSCCRLTHKLAGTPVASDWLLMDLDSV